jgi:hydroxypyruvate isomerase
MSAIVSRRSAIKTATATAAAVTASLSAGVRSLEAAALNGNINHSVCKWCYGGIELDTFCASAKKIGLQSVELLGPKDWPTLKKHGLTCAMANGAELNLVDGFSDPKFHDKLFERYSAMIPKVAKAGLKNLICFSGNRRGLADDQGIKNCAIGLKRLMPIAERHGVVVVMELLNSKVNHKDYQCDHTAWGVELCKAVGSENFKLLYDIYHMQIMEGDLIRNIRDFHPYIAHYHTGGNPGRHEIDDSQEIYYPAVMRAILETGFKGHVAQEFIPAKADKIASLAEGVNICDV